MKLRATAVMLACWCSSAIGASDPATGQPKETSRYILYKFLQPIGSERDTFTPIGDGSTAARAIFTFNDRGTDVPFAASWRVGPDGLPVDYDAWGDIARGAHLDDHVHSDGAGKFRVTRLGAALRTITVTTPWAMISGYSPLLGQELLARTWIARGRPARLPLLPEGEAELESRGEETYALEGKQLTFEHVAVRGLVWGREDLWLDEAGKLAALVTRDAEYDHFEGARMQYAPLIEQLVARAAADAVAALADAARAGSEPARLVALVGGRLIDGSGAPPVDDAVIVYDGDRIVAAGSRATTHIPDGARRIDVSGKTIIPGLWDMHAHVEQVEQLAAYLAAGVTTVRDEGNIMSFITSLRDTVEAGRGLGPRIIVDGLVDGAGKRSLGTLQVDRESEIAPMIDQLVKAHCAELKIYSSVRPELVPKLVAEAHRRGLRVTGHVPSGMDVIDALAAGFDGINHVSHVTSLALPKKRDDLRKLTRDEIRRRLMAIDLASPPFARALQTMAQRKTVLDPTLALMELGSYPLDELQRREPGIAKLPRELRHGIQGVDPENAALSDGIFKKELAIVGEAHRRGVPIVAGTDQAVIGHSLHRELELYVAAGFTPLEALQSATLVPARALGRDRDLGTIAPGKRADLVILDGDPLADIRNTRKIAFVIARGQMREPAPLWKLSGFSP
jgi:imidazolonepropionase-like amidohydrolase